MAPPRWSRLETEMVKDLVCAGHYVCHRERSSVSGDGVPHVNSPMAGIQTRMAKFTAVNPLPPDLEFKVILKMISWLCITF